MKRLHTLFVAISCLALTQVAESGELSLYAAHPGTVEFDLPDIKGQQHQLEDYRGQVVLVNFWASWCVPCVTEMPGMQRLQDALEDQPFEILAINVSESENRVREFVKRMNLNMTILLDHNGNTFEAWQGKVLPASFLLDRSGRIRYRVIGPVEWDSDEPRKTIEALIHNTTE